MTDGGAAVARGGSSWRRRVKRALVLLIAGFLTLSVTFVMIYRFLPPPITPLMVIRLIQGEGLRKDWVSYDQVSPQLFKAVIAAEDARFCQHYGFEVGAMLDAWRSNLKGRHLRGASTISMQTAKNLFLWPGRDPLRKAFEAYFTVLLELFWDKRRILEVYVNIIEFGPGIYGIEAASETYYKKPAKDLTAVEAARLASVLPNPRKWSPQKLPRKSKLARVRADMSDQPPPLDGRCPVGPYEDRP